MPRNLVVRGGGRLCGEISAQGGKNAVLPILAACLLIDDTVKLYNCPDISDVKNMLLILKDLGCICNREGDVITVKAENTKSWVMPEDLSQRLRSSFFLLGPVLGRFKKALFTYPGGCSIGMRPIDIHLHGLRSLNVTINESAGYIDCVADKLEGTGIHLDYPSVGATENIMMAAVYAKGTTSIENAAQEPEIIELQNFLNRMGARISGAGTATILIEGVKKLSGGQYTIMPDRIETGTYLGAAAITGGEIIIWKSNASHLTPVITKFSQMGCNTFCGDDFISLKAPQKLLAPKRIETYPYPGFPTDMQAPFCALASVANGVTLVMENVFENRFKHVQELNKMGANITVKRRMAIIEGVESLHGAKLVAEEVRGGASLLLASLTAEGESIISGTDHIERGYGDFISKLISLNADVSME